ncbi:hypothetical protein MTO96_040589, partial [Rhipicephalus appendiculatus]
MPKPVSTRVVSCVSVNTSRICIPQQMQRPKAVGADPVKPRGGRTSASLRGTVCEAAGLDRIGLSPASPDSVSVAASWSGTASVACMRQRAPRVGNDVQIVTRGDRATRHYIGAARERTLSELRYGVELLVSKVTLLEPRLSRMDTAIGRLERALLRESTTSESSTGHQTRFPPRPIGYPSGKGCGSSSLSSSGDKAATVELASIGDQLRDLRDEQRFFRHMLGDLRNYTTHSSDRIIAKLEQRGFMLARPAVNIQTSRPVIVGGKTSANGAPHLLRPQVLPWESQPSMSSGSLSSSGTGSARPLHMVELKNNHRSPSGSAPPFRTQGTATAHRRQDKVRGIFTDLFGSTRTNIAKHLRQ